MSTESGTAQNVVREHNGDWWYVIGPSLDNPVLVIKRGFSGMANATQAVLPVVSNGRGQLIAIADTAGQLQGSYVGPQYDAGLWNSSGLTSHAQSFNPRRWAVPGGIDTISTFRNRQYDPATGRWLQEDPMGIAGGVNLYQYTGNDPNSFSDPFGLQSDSSSTAQTQGGDSTKKCSGLARVLKGNAATIGQPGGFGDVVTSGGAAIAPEQWGGKAAARGIRNSVSGEFPSAGTSFQGIVDVIGGTRRPRGFSPQNGSVRTALMARYPGKLLIELPGASKDNGITTVVLTIPAGKSCPAGTQEVQQ
ncbi:MAG: RHS repeat-associated core domain-containing protein [Gemmatimonadales bacterium]